MTQSSSSNTDAGDASNDKGEQVDPDQLDGYQLDHIVGGGLLRRTTAPKFTTNAPTTLRPNTIV